MLVHQIRAWCCWLASTRAAAVRLEALPSPIASRRLMSSGSSASSPRRASPTRRRGCGMTTSPTSRRSCRPGERRTRVHRYGNAPIGRWAARSTSTMRDVRRQTHSANSRSELQRVRQGACAGVPFGWRPEASYAGRGGVGSDRSRRRGASNPDRIRNCSRPARSFQFGDTTSCDLSARGSTPLALQWMRGFNLATSSYGGMNRIVRNRGQVDHVHRDGTTRRNRDGA